MKYYQERDYEDIIHLPHHVSKKHSQMSLLDRAAQFSPFAALTGHEDAINETARIVDAQIILEEDEKDILNANLQEIKMHLAEHPEVEITYFKPDELKSGGRYERICGHIKKIDEYKKCIILENSEIIRMEYMIGIEII